MARISNDAFEPFCPHFCLFIDIQPTGTDRQLSRNNKQPRHFVFCSISLYLFVPHPAGPAQFALISARGRGCEARVFAVKRDIAPGVWRTRSPMSIGRTAFHGASFVVGALFMAVV